MSEAWFILIIVVVYLAGGIVISLWLVKQMDFTDYDDPDDEVRPSTRFWCGVAITALWLPLGLVILCAITERQLRRRFGGSHDR